MSNHLLNLRHQYKQFIQEALSDSVDVELGKQVLLEIRAAGRDLADVDERERYAQMARDIGDQLLDATGVYLPVRLEPLDARRTRPLIPDLPAQISLSSLPLDTIPAPAPLPPGSRMPMHLNPLFVGREADLMALASVLKGAPAIDAVGAARLGRPPAAIITGIGGVGKTQLAAEIAHRYGQFFAGGVFWISFADPGGVDAEIAACGGPGTLELYIDADGLTQAEQVAMVYAAWSQPIPRLLIFDNCDDFSNTTAEQQLAAHLPTSGGCRVLVTSRRGHWPPLLGLIVHPLDVLARAASVALLRSFRPDLSDAAADAIAETLGDLPLALSLAGGYLDAYRDAAFGQPAVYLADLRATLLDHRSLQGAGAPFSPTNHERNVYATIALSYQRLNSADTTDALAIKLLVRASYLAPGEPFPRDLLLATIGEAADEELAVQQADALRRLADLGLLEQAADGALRIHTLIAAFAQEAAQDDAALPAVERVLSDRAYAINQVGYPAAMLPFLAHLRHATARARARGGAQAATLCNTLGYYLKLIGDYVAARPLYEHALAIREQTQGADHLDTAGSLNNLAGLLVSQGDYAAARPLYERALAIREQTLGPSHPDTAASLNNLAELLRSQGEYTAARPLLERALAVSEQALGSDHAHTVASLNNLASLFVSQGDYAAARPLLKRALAISEQVLGSQHPDTAQSLNNLAGLLANQGDYAAARPLLERALAIYERELGSQHPDTAQILNNLAGLLVGQGDYAAARPLYERALVIRAQTLGTDHPDTAASMHNLAALHRRQHELRSQMERHDLPETPITEDDIMALVHEGAAGRTVEAAEEDMITGVFTFTDRTVRSLMTPRTQIAALAIDTPLPQALAQIVEAGYSRLPVYRDTIDQIVGVLYVKDLLRAWGRAGQVDLEELLRLPLYVLQKQRVIVAFQQLKQNQAGMALVLDEYGQIAGLITVEDMLEALVGDIADEYDEEDSDAFVPRDDGSYLVDGMMSFADLRQRVGLPEADALRREYEFETLAEFLLALLGHIPSVGERVDWRGYSFEIVDMDERRIDRVLVQPPALRAALAAADTPAVPDPETLPASRPNSDDA